MGKGGPRFFLVREKDPREPYHPHSRRATRNGDVVYGPRVQRARSRDVRWSLIRTSHGGPLHPKTLDARAGFNDDIQAHYAPAAPGDGGPDEKPAKPAHASHKDKKSQKHTSSKSRKGKSSSSSKAPASPKAAPPHAETPSGRRAAEPAVTLQRAMEYLEYIDHFFSPEELMLLLRLEHEYLGENMGVEKWGWIASRFFDWTGRMEASGNVKNVLRGVREWA